MSTYEEDSQTEQARFWAKVDKTDACWLWTASTRNKGYGAFVYRRAGKVIHGRAHRYAYELFYGPLLPDMKVLHNCPGGDNPACVNPAHLWIGTIADNNRDLVRKGRHVPGGTYGPGNYKRGAAWYKAHAQRLSSPRLSSRTVGPPIIYDYDAIRTDREMHQLSYPQLARKYGCSISHAQRICQKGGTKNG